MSASETTQLRHRWTPVAALRVDVTEGPNAGAHVEAPEGVLTVGTARGNGLVLADDSASRFHLELSGHAHGVHVADLGSTNGTLFSGARVERCVVPVGSVLRVGRSALRVGSAGEGRVELLEGETLAGLRGRSTAMRQVLERLRQVAPSAVTVLLTGESGTGKEVAARALHELSPRAKGPFVVVDCAALVPTLVASELFGHEKGAFTGADRAHPGAFERAHGGTLFLDEVGELPASLQSALLGAIERRRVRRLGGRGDLDVDVRLLSATNRDLRSEVNGGAFRLDLYYRLAVVELRLPPLRERPDDVAPLLEHFLREQGHAGPVEEFFSPAVLASLRAHAWPGNVRELRNLVEASVALGGSPSITTAANSGEANAPAQRLVPWSAPADGAALESYRDARGAVLHAFEAAYLRALVQRAEGNMSKAARLSGLDRGYVSAMLTRHGIERK